MKDNNRIRRFILMFEVNVTLILFLNGCSVFIPPNLYLHGAIDLEVKATIQFPDVNESSALVKSRQFDDVYWTLNDSGDRARVFAIRKNGSIIKPEDSINYHGLSVTNAGNIDWEDMAVDNNGNLYIAAFGNNKNVRQDLSVYILPEPDPFKTDNAQTSAQIRFHYQAQHKFPPVKHNFDSEALFVADGKLVIDASIKDFIRAGKISEHDGLIASKLAYVLTGGAKGSVFSPVDEQYLLDIEREVFVSLCAEPKSIARIEYMLKKGKPLRN